MKIQIIGASGTGKSTLGKYISEKTGIYWIDTDKYLWKDANFTQQYPVAKRLEMCNYDITNYRDYIVSGSVHTWNPEGFHDRELLVLLRLDEEIRMKRLYDRELTRFGNRMLQGGEHYELTCEFLEWCKTYVTEDENAVCSLACHMRLMNKAICKTLILNSDEPIGSLCSSILDVIT